MIRKQLNLARFLFAQAGPPERKARWRIIRSMWFTSSGKMMRKQLNLARFLFAQAGPPERKAR